MKKRINLQRTFEASLDLVWELWTTKDGIESWWGPPGFVVKVSRLELRAGGALEYVMTCVGAEQIAFMKQHNQPLSTPLKARYTEVKPKTLAAWMNLADFIPGVDPYEVEARLMLTPLAAESVRVDLQIDAMHNEFYTSMATQGWESEMGKLAAIIEEPEEVMSTLIPFLWFNDEAEEAARYYVEVFPRAKMGEIQRFPAGGRGPEGSVMTASFTLGDQRLVALNGNPRFAFSPAMSLLYSCASADAASRLTERLSAGGEKQPGGWVRDKYGVSWQVHALA